MPKGDRERGKADPEDGTTPIAHLLLESLAKAPLSGVQKGLVLYLWRETYGWLDGTTRRRAKTISLAEWAEGVSSSPTYVARALQGLVRAKVLLQEDLGKGKGYSYTTNTSVIQWGEGSVKGWGSAKQIRVLSTKRTRVLSTKRTTPLATDLPTPKERLNKIKEREIDNTELLTEEVVFQETVVIAATGEVVSVVELWERLKEQLNGKIATANYETWINYIHPVGFTEETLIIEATDFVAKNVNARLISIMQLKLSELLDRPMKVHCRSDE